MSKLPPQVTPRLLDNPYAVSSYNMCLKLEKDLQDEIDAGHDVGRSMIYCRILGYLLLHAPSDKAFSVVRREIDACEEKSDRLLQVGAIYYNHYIRAFRSNKGKVPAPSNHASRPSFDTLADMIKDLLEEAPQNHSGAKANALVRDKFRCPISGIVDATSFLKNSELRQMVAREKLRLGNTQCAHIISESINTNITQGSPKEQYAATVWTVLDRFGYRGLSDELNGPKVHRLDNVITMELYVHNYFDNLRLWLIATDEVNRYILEAVDPVLLGGLPQRVTFTTDKENLPVPNPTFLALHASCAKVGHLSGAAEYIDKVFGDMEEIRVLSADGASADVLEHALLYASSRPILV
ncbi:hypothetical protein M422DRAFT_37885 [Sphaerobolus stellatus SS14]|uniref:HNH nuclease domain-containing protein n=1 Tax=Sphaerobolus stellatus (strain SS14) TaxID=990650 RepID=A0A0C9UPH5_SPHS4|nr:hypothetical protein M422DRAFT_37885 [Sphaerobolus stellatus SS14]